MFAAEITSERLHGRRTIWVQPPVGGVAENCCLLLDGELYRERVNAPQIVADLQDRKVIPPTQFVYLSALDAAARHQDFTCNPEYSEFLVEELVPWMRARVGDVTPIFLGGLSLSGLCAAYTLQKYPAVFAGCLCQSPSAWWADEWLTHSLLEPVIPAGRYWLSVGTEELQADVKHPPTGMHQKTTQLHSVRRLTERLRACGADVFLNEYVGEHEPRCWAEELPEALAWLLGTVKADNR